MSDKEKEVDKTENKDDFEKRYKDSQTHITKIEAENALMRETSQKDKELLDAVTPYVDWESVNGTKKTEVVVEEDTLVDQKTLTKTVEDLRSLIERERVTNSFRTKYPGMIEYEDLVGSFLNKTDARRPMEERIAKAVKNTQDLLDSERSKGVELSKKEKKEKAAKEAEASGLSGGKVSLESKDDSGGETYEEYIESRKKMSAKAQGIRS